MKPELQKATPLGGGKLRLEYADGLTAVLDFAERLASAKYRPIAAPEVFAGVFVESGALTWPNGFDICPDVTRFWAETGRVATPQETDAHFAAHDPVAA